MGCRPGPCDQTAQANVHPCRGRTCDNQNSRPSKLLLHVPWSLAFLPHESQVRQELTALRHFAGGLAFFDQGAGGAYVNAFAAGGAAFRLSPRLVEVADDASVNPASEEVPGMRTLDFLANANAASTENASVVIGHEATVRGVNFELGMEIRNGDVREPDLLGERLQFTVTIRNADRTNVI